MAVPTSITDISTTASSNSPQGSESIGNPGKIDDYFRGYGAVFRAETLNKTWERWNDTPTYIGATQFSVATDLTARYTVNRRIKATVTAGTVYGRITASVFGSVTTVTVSLDSGSLDSGLSEVMLGPEPKGFWTTSAGLAAQLTDETGTGSVVFSASPTFTGTVLAAAVTTSGILTARVVGTGVANSSYETTSDAVIEGVDRAGTNGGNLGIYADNAIAADKGGSLIVGAKYTANIGVGFGRIKGGKDDGVDGNFAGYLSFGTQGGSGITERLRITSDGRIYGTGIHNNAGAVTGTTNQYIASGTYSPTFASGSNLDSTPTQSTTFKWIRVGNVAMVCGGIAVDPTAAATCVWTATLPITITGGSQSRALCGWAGRDGNSGEVTGDGGTPYKASFNWTAPSGSSTTIECFFMYEVL